MRFRREADLRDALADSAFAVASAGEVCFVRTEVLVGGCVPDLVVVCVNAAPTKDLWPARWTLRHAFMVHHLRQRRHLSLETLAGRFYESPERVRPGLMELVRSGTVVEGADGRFSLRHELATLSAEVIAIEAKLIRWKEALAQAEAYSDFADRCIVAMDPGGVPRRKESKELFAHSGVGLISFDGLEKKTIVRSKLRRTSSPEREYILARALGRTTQTPWSRLYI